VERLALPFKGAAEKETAANRRTVAEARAATAANPSEDPVVMAA
jgi:hypothetical protein